MDHEVKTVPSHSRKATLKDSIELLQPSALGMGVEAILSDFIHYHSHLLGRRTLHTESPFHYQSLVLAIRDRLMERWNRTNMAVDKNQNRRAYYLSLEFLPGRLLRNALLSLDLGESAAGAMESLGIALEDLYERENEAGLGNGGLGRLAACFLDSCATLNLPVVGYGIRYKYGMFHQRIEDGNQVEAPDAWLRDHFPWEIERRELTRTIRFGGRTTSFRDESGRRHHRWIDTHDVLATPFDIPIPGYRNGIVNTLRLWSAAATDAFDLEEFNAGDYTDAVAAKNAAENITMVLYPNAGTENGRELRLKQQYFLASASLQDVLAYYFSRYGQDFSQFAEKNCFHLNETHPAIAVPELMRLLMDEYHLEWDTAWELTKRTMAYTNHTLLPEALETWPLSLFKRLLPRPLEIIYEINARLLKEVNKRWPGDFDRMNRMSLIREDFEQKVQMANLAITGSYSVNGVAKLHSRLLTQDLFLDFAELWPDKFNNKTNGVTQRRWLAACNPGLSELISSKIGDGWITDLEQIKGLFSLADDGEFQQRWRAIRRANKERLGVFLKGRNGLDIDPTMMFDVQVKRIHEYKRQMLNVLHAIHLYDRLLRGDEEGFVPRTIIIGGKAAPDYLMAKKVIKLINSVAEAISTEPATNGKLRLVFCRDYNVSAMEVICPAADLSEQISTAGREASGTGNMKFMMNGAVTIGTLDGANIEILEAVGEENFFLFGLTVDEIGKARAHYDPGAIIAADADFSRVMDLLESGHFNPSDPELFDDVIASIQSPYDAWMTAADFRSFIDAQARAARAFQDEQGWTAMSIRNTAASGRFSTDRTIMEYNRDIWHLDPIDVTTP